jgi:hypothetical protein
LSETGLYTAGSTEELAPGVTPYSPRYALWSDGASKQRWLLLPEDTQIDTSDMDSWVFPVGTKVWKEFARDGKRLETRLLWKTETGWLRVAYVWNDDESEAMATPRGAPDVRGTTHDVPERGACSSCHAGRDYLLGVSAIQLAHPGAGVTLSSLIADDRLSDPPANPDALSLPDTPAWNALGYLHANCGNCHNPKSDAWDRVDNFDLWLRVAELGDPMSTQSWRSTVSVALTDTDTTGGLSLRIVPGNAAMSGLIQRMSVRGSENAMPPLASERVDTDGVAVISGWIDGL